jgi:hypothetical protein
VFNNTDIQLSLIVVLFTSIVVNYTTKTIYSQPYNDTEAGSIRWRKKKITSFEGTPKMVLREEGIGITSSDVINNSSLLEASTVKFSTPKT